MGEEKYANFRVAEQYDQKNMQIFLSAAIYLNTTMHEKNGLSYANELAIHGSQKNCLLDKKYVNLKSGNEISKF